MVFPRDRYLHRLYLTYIPIHDLPYTKGIKFQYADDISIAYCIDLEEGGKVLNEDLITMNKYFSECRLKPNPAKYALFTETTRDELKVTFQGVQIKHNFTPKYLGITLDCTLKFKKNLDRTGKKVQSRINLIQKLAGAGLKTFIRTF